MLIIVEGPDCAGKTTLCDEIEKFIRTSYATRNDVVVRLKAGPPRFHPLTEYEGPLLRYRPVSDRHVICDRWHLGEHVYPPVLGRKTELTSAISRHIALFLRARGAVTVVLEQSTKQLRECVTTRGDELVKSEWLDAISRRYRELPEEWNPDVRELAPLADVERLVELAHAAEHRAVGLRNFVTYIGVHEPSVLLVGDVRGVDGRYAHTRNPAFMPYAGTCGAFLLRYFYHDAVGVANACDVDDVRALWVTLGRPPTVALGLKAHQRLSVLNVPHGVVPHPQFVRRFYARSGARYAQLIEDAAFGGKDLMRADLS